MDNLTFRNEDEARAYMAQNPGQQFEMRYNKPQTDPRQEYINMFYELAKANPNNEQITNGYMSALLDYYNPQGSRYQEQQQRRDSDMELAKMLGSIDSPQAEQATMGMLSRYSPELAQQSQEEQYDPYNIFRNAQKTQMDNLVKSENFDATNQKSLDEIARLGQLYDLSREQYGQYKAPITGREFWGNLFAKGNNAEAARLKRLGL